MNQELYNILNAGRKCLLISNIDSKINLGICNYTFYDNKLFIESTTYTTVLENLNNNPNCILYITVCDHECIYYMIIKGCANLSSTDFKTPSLSNQNNKYLICISIDDIDLYKEKRR